MTNEQIIKNIFVNLLGVEESEVTPEATNNDLQMDSLDKIEITVEIESEFNINITDSEMQSLKQFSDYVAIVERKVKP